MQRLVSLVRTLSSLSSTWTSKTTGILTKSTNMRALLEPSTPMITSICNFKIMGRVRRRCKSCYMVYRDARIYVMCPKHPRHKQMAMKAKPLNTWVLTHASQSPVRPW